MSQGIIFDIKKYSINDGPGIRTTVFFKGCPLRCRWCHNPEGQSFQPELMVRPSRCLKNCAECVTACDLNALSKPGDIPVLDWERCTGCGMCADACSTLAIEVVGRRLSESAVMAEILKDRIFQEESGGGVTFSGGEPLSQPDFLAALLAECRKNEIHTAVDTCGFAPPEAFEKVTDAADLFLYDLKLIDEKKHEELTGHSNRMILENLKRLAARKKPVVIRLPIIPGVNEDEENIRATAAFLRTLNAIEEVSLLPYHRLGREKYKGLQKKSAGEDFASPSPEKLKTIKGDLEAHGFRVRLGE
ncbi:MAG: glycyl-radical enzyme activating protein [Acidobacteriota bacterium]